MGKKIMPTVIYIVEKELGFNNCSEIKSVWWWGEKQSGKKAAVRRTENTLCQEVLRIFRKVGHN